MARGDIRQKITLEGGEEVRRQLQQIGQSGERAANQIGGAFGAQGQGFAALDSSVARSFAILGQTGAALAPAKAAFADLHALTSRFGNALSNLGAVLVPAFASNLKLGLGAAFAGAAFGLKGIVGSASDSIIALRNLSIQSGLSRTAIMGIKDVFEDAGVPVENLTAFVGRWSEELGKAREEARKAAGTLGQTQDKVSVLAGAIAKANGQFVDQVDVMRGGTKVVRDTSDAFKSLGMNVRAFPDTMAGNQAALIEFSRRLGLVKDGTEQARIGAQLFGRTWRVEAAGILKLATQLEGAMKERALKGLTISPEEEQKALAYKKAVNDLGDQWERTAQQIGGAVFPVLTKMGENMEFNIQNMRAAVGPFTEMVGALKETILRADFAGLWRGVVEIWKADLGGVVAFAGTVWTGIGTAATLAMQSIVSTLTTHSAQMALIVQNMWTLIQETWTNGTLWVQQTWDVLFAYLINGINTIGDWFAGHWENIKTGFTSVARSIGQQIDWIIDKVKQAAKAIASAFSGGGGGIAATAPIPPMTQNARGGLIRGPGTGLSDSILARLSDGEYVIRAAAVRHFGVNMFEAMNRLHSPKFAMGGLVDAMNTSLLPRSRGFKAGGLVAAERGGQGRAAFNIVLDGRSFAVSGRPDVVGELGKAARALRIRSGGRAPSWVG